MLSVDKSEILCAGRHQIYAEILDKLFTRLLSLEAELVFFMDGSIKESKFNTWQRRQNHKYNESMKIMNMVYDEVPLKTIVQKHGSNVYTNTLLSSIEGKRL
jgi:hypothetical protein